MLLVSSFTQQWILIRKMHSKIHRTEIEWKPTSDKQRVPAATINFHHFCAFENLDPFCGPCALSNFFGRWYLSILLFFCFYLCFVWGSNDALPLNNNCCLERVYNSIFDYVNFPYCFPIRLKFHVQMHIGHSRICDIWIIHYYRMNVISSVGYVNSFSFHPA